MHEQGPDRLGADAAEQGPEAIAEHIEREDSPQKGGPPSALISQQENESLDRAIRAVVKMSGTHSRTPAEAHGKAS